MNIYVSHSNALVSAGLVATMQKIAGCKVRSEKDEQSSWRYALQDVDLLVADSATLMGSIARPNDPDSTQRLRKPQIVLVMASGTAGPEMDPMPPGISACLPIDCGQNELLQTVCSLLGSTHQCARAKAEATSSEPSATLHPRGGVAPAALRRVQEYIDRSLGERINVDDLAALTGLSACHFSRAFKQSVGVSPHRYLMSRRVVAATRLIASTERPMSEIAIEVGFSDQSHFTRVFKAQLGQSPRRFRHQCR